MSMKRELEKWILTASFFACAATVSACRKDLPAPQTSNVRSAPTAQPNDASPPRLAPDAPRDNAKVKLFTSSGTVTKIDLKMVSVELDHEEIKGLMPKMRMEFFVQNKAELEALALGDRVEFVLEDNAGAERIVSIRKIP